MKKAPKKAPTTAPKKKKKALQAPKVGSHKAGKPSFSVKWSRGQVMRRTGKRGPGQSMALKFAKFGGDSDKAIAAAKRGVAKAIAGGA
eukprot:7373400-Pyramimonas_sp.AAC.1